MGYPRAESRVRFVPDTGLFEMQCGSCKEYVELVPENWRPKNGLTRCAACWADYSRLKERGYRSVEASVELRRIRRRMYYIDNREALLERNRAWKRANRERISVYNREYSARQKAAA